MRIAFYRLVLFLNTTTEQDVYYTSARIILNNIRKIPDYSITDVAKLCYVSPATISRLCRKLNFESFADFKNTVILSIQQFNYSYKNIYFPVENKNVLTLKNSDNLLKLHHESVIETLNDVYQRINTQEILQLVEMIHHCRRVIFIGYYFSQNTAMQLQIELAYLQKECYGVFDEKGQKNILSNTNKNDLIILNSMTGKFTQQSLEVMRLFKQSAAKKVMIGQLIESPYLDKLDLHIDISDNKDSLISKFSLTYLFEVIEMFYHIRYSNTTR